MSPLALLFTIGLFAYVPVAPGRCWQDVWKVGELLDHDDAVVARGLKEGGDGVADQNGDQNGDTVGDLERERNITLRTDVLHTYI